MAKTVRQKPWTPTDEKIREATERIVREFDPLKVILFGSCARGEVTGDSDVDFLVVFDQIKEPMESAAAILDALADAPFTKDVLVTTPGDIERSATLKNSVVKTALREGAVLYERD